MLQYTNFPQKNAVYGLIFVAILVIGVIAFRKGTLNKAAELGINFLTTLLQKIQKK